MSDVPADGRAKDPASEPAAYPAAGPEADPVDVARLICLRQLEMAPRTRAQLATVLARKSVPAEAAQVVLDRFVEVGLIDDAEYARAWVDSRHRGRGLARRALSQELRQRGVAEPEAAQALAMLDTDMELATARQLVARKLASTARLDPAARMRRLGGMLARKGYPPAVAFHVVREALAGEADSGDTEVGDTQVGDTQVGDTDI